MRIAFETFGAYVLGAAVYAGLILPTRADETPSAPPLYYNGAPAPAPVYGTDATAGQMSEVLKLIQAKVDPAVIKAYVENSPAAFQPTADDLIQLKNAGATPEVLKAVVDHAGAVRAQANQTAAAQPSYPASSAQTAYPPSTSQTYYPASQSSDNSESTYSSPETSTVYPTTYYSSYSYGWPWYIGFGLYWPSYCYGGYYPYGCYYNHGYYPWYHPYYGYHGYYPYGYSGYYHNHNGNWGSGGHWTQQPGSVHPVHATGSTGFGAASGHFMSHSTMGGVSTVHSPTAFRPSAVRMSSGPAYSHGMSFGSRPAAPSFHSMGGGGMHFGGGSGGGMHFAGGGGSMHFGGGGGFRH